MLRATLFAVTAVLAFQFGANAQEDGPVIVSEQVQRLAADFPIADRLGIKWGGASTADIGRYMGMLAALSEVAKTVGLKNGRETPSDDDYKAAFAAFCIWPPNKPPIAEPYWEKVMAAFDNAKVRDALRANVGYLTVELPSLISSGQADDAVLAKWPKDEAGYSSSVFDFESLRNGP